MHTNLNESGENFDKNTNAQPVQINPTAEKRFQTKSKKNLTVEINTYKDITPNQTLSEEHRNEEI